jgi:hypothetical protein
VYWSGFDTAILWTGILTFVVAILPFYVLTPLTRWGIAGAGVVIIITSIVTGGIEAVTYPFFTEFAPVFPVGLAVLLIIGRQSTLRTARRDDLAKYGSPDAPMPVFQRPDAVATTLPSEYSDIPHADLEWQAHNPHTDQQTLANIANEYPEYRAAIAANPNSYPALLEWLAALEDPEVTVALENRNN